LVEGSFLNTIQRVTILAAEPGSGPQSQSQERTGILRVGDLLVDLERRKVSRGGTGLDVTDRSFRLFESLVRHAPEEVSKDQLIADVWDDAVVSDETLAQRVRLLRQSLGDDSQDPKYIASVRGRGYRLVAATRAVESESEQRQRTWMRYAVAAILIVGVILGWHLLRDQDAEPKAGAQAADALAVLPFKDMSAGQDQQFFADGMHEELLSRLAMIDGLSVISRTSVERFGESKAGLPDIAAQLGVDAVVEGSVRVDGNSLRVTAQLIDASSDEHLWAANFDRQLSMHDIFSLQTEIATAIAEALRLEYANNAAYSLQLPTNSMQAYNLYLLGRYHVFRQTRPDLEKGISYLQQAIDIDDEFAEAYATLGWAYSFLGTVYGARPPKEMYPQAKEAALRAIALDDTLADARSLYADILTWYDWDFDAAEREYLKTLELDELNVLGYALFLSTQERHDEAITLIKRRLAAQPNDPWVWVNAGWLYLSAGRPDEAIEAAERAADHNDSKAIIGWGRLAQGDKAGAIDMFAEVLRAQGHTIRNVTNLAIANYRGGRDAEGDQLLAELETLAEETYVPASSLAAIHFTAGNADRGFAYLEEAFAERSRSLIFLRVNQWTLDYRDDPRYVDLVERVGL